MSYGQDEESALRREALISGLRVTLKEPLAQSALRIWMERYERTRPLEIAEFVEELAREFVLPSRRAAAVRLALYQALIESAQRP